MWLAPTCPPFLPEVRAVPRAPQLPGGIEAGTPLQPLFAVKPRFAVRFVSVSRMSILTRFRFARFAAVLLSVRFSLENPAGCFGCSGHSV